MSDRVKCPGCGHTTKSGLVDEAGLCPVCHVDAAEPEAEVPEKRGER